MTRQQSGDTVYRIYTYASDETVAEDHSRIEIRQAWTISDPL